MHMVTQISKKETDLTPWEIQISIMKTRRKKKIMKLGEIIKMFEYL
jgi:hypothetical protein